jgi:hypothetical protein
LVDVSHFSLIGLQRILFFGTRAPGENLGIKFDSDANSEQCSIIHVAESILLAHIRHTADMAAFELWNVFEPCYTDANSTYTDACRGPCHRTSERTVE